ncbi:ArpU family phage packaging/lysis transcriptional regulator [Dellaglioa sp. L3N]
MLLDELDETATKRNSIKVLRSYPRYKRIANRNILFLQSPAMEGMPKSKSGANNEEVKIVNKLEAETIVKTIEHCIESIVGSDYRMLLENTYIHGDSDYEIQSTLGISKSTQDRMLKVALLNFAEAYPLEELLAFC